MSLNLNGITFKNKSKSSDCINPAYIELTNVLNKTIVYYISLAYFIYSFSLSG